MTSALVNSVQPSAGLFTHVSLSRMSMQTMVSARLTMSALYRASVFALIFSGVIVTSEAQTPAPAPGKCLFFEEI